MNNEPVAYVDNVWINRPDLAMDLGIGQMFSRCQLSDHQIPLYTHPADTIPYKDLHQVVKSVLAHPAELTDEEINKLWAESHEDGIAMQQGFTTQQHYFAHLILKKAQEK